MLPLDSPQWNKLRGAYDPADWLPQFLTDLRSAKPDHDELVELINPLLHQGTIYPATLAMVPHLVDIVRRRSPADRFGILGFIGIAAESYCTPAEGEVWCKDECPPGVVEAYEAAIRDTIPVVLESLCLHWSLEDFRYLLSTLAACHGHDVISCVLDGRIQCPKCQEPVDPFWDID